jgi:two-component system CheB/CheR fusion protein
VKEAGGTVIVQDPGTATYPSLPASIPPSEVDLIAPLDSMSGLLSTLAARREIPESLRDDDMLRAFLTQLRGRSGIDFTQYKMPTIVRRLSRLMTAARCNSLPEYMRFLNANPEAYQRLVGSFLIKVTGFFRDPALYKHLREEILPDIIEYARSHRTELRVWSAGCATGEEPYSIAILLSELLGDEVDDMQIRIFATDLDADSIVFARRGHYPASALSLMEPELVQRYFTKIDDSYQVKKRIRNLTVFGEYDLGQRAPFPRIDLILCRNVLIYFTKDLQQRTLQLFAFSLRQAGYLVLGKSETTSPLPQYFTPVHQVLKVFRRQGERLLIPAPALADASNATAIMERPSVRRNALRPVNLPRRAVDAPPRWSLAERLGSFLFDSSIGVVVVDRNYDIQTINQAARSLLGIHGQGIGDDLIHLASNIEGAQLKNALDSAFRSEIPVVEHEFHVSDQLDGEPQYLQIWCYPDKSANKDGRINAAIVLVLDVTRSARRRYQLEGENRERTQLVERLAKQNEELQQRQRSLVEANTELTAANNDLRSANEHLLIAAEEAEASAEEVETLNEEMQATSEELETLNEELQATVEELNTTNEELGARSNELERAVAERQAQLQRSDLERRLYEGAIAHLPLPVAVVSSDGKILSASNAYRELASSSKTLRGVGETWMEPPDGEASAQSMRVDVDGHPARLIVVTTR